MELVTVPTPEGPAEALFVHPEGEGPWPGVLMGMDALGVRPRLEDMAREIASWGYAVLVPNAFHRTKSVAEVMPDEPLITDEQRGAFFRRIGPTLGSLTADQIDSDVDAWVAYLRSRPEVAPDAMGFVGYCFGVRVGVRAAGRHPDTFACVAGFHGGNVATDAPDSPHLELATAKARFVLLHADDDGSMPPAQVARLDEAFAAAGLHAVNEIVPGARHGYTMADTGAYDEAATRRAFAATRELFAATL